MERTLIQQIVVAVDSKYLKALQDPVTNKITHTIPDMLTHLFNAYGHVTPTDLYDLKQKVKTVQFSPQEPEDTLITEIDDVADIADLAGSPITDRQRVHIGYIALQQCKPFKTAQQEWNKQLHSRIGTRSKHIFAMRKSPCAKQGKSQSKKA